MASIFEISLETLQCIRMVYILAVGRQQGNSGMVKLAAVCVASLVASVSVQVKFAEITAVLLLNSTKMKHVRRNYPQVEHMITLTGTHYCVQLQAARSEH